MIAEKKRLLATTLGSADFIVCTASFLVWLEYAPTTARWAVPRGLLDPRLDQFLAFLPLVALWLFLLPPDAPAPDQGRSALLSNPARLLHVTTAVLAAAAGWTAALLALNIPLSGALRMGALAGAAGITYFAILRPEVHGIIRVFFRWRQFEERTWVVHTDDIPAEHAVATVRSAGWPLKPVAVTPWSEVMDAFAASEEPASIPTQWARDHILSRAVDCLLLAGTIDDAARNRLAHLCRRMGLTLAECRSGTSGEPGRIEEVTAPPWSASGLLIKEILDASVALALLVAALPLLLLLGALVRWTSRGPAIFHQERMGRRGRLFRMLKFRSMYIDAAAPLPQAVEPPDILFKHPDDPRVTPFGRLMRRTSLDELPQLWNVLRGEMSLVGPRPMPLYEIQHFRRIEDFRRHALKPGLTGLWQVSGRSNIRSLEERLRLDLTYVDQWSLWLDVKILLRTIPAVLTGRGAQ